MPRTLLAPLTVKEENTLRLLAHGIRKPKNLRADDLSRLQHFGFAEVTDGVARLTPLGEQRFAIIDRRRSEADRQA